MFRKRYLMPWIAYSAQLCEIGAKLRKLIILSSFASFSLACKSSHNSFSFRVKEDEHITKIRKQKLVFFFSFSLKAFSNKPAFIFICHFPFCICIESEYP